MSFFFSFLEDQISHPRPLARFSFQSIMAGPAGIFKHFLAVKSIKKVPKERGTRSNAGLGASGYIAFFFIIRPFPIFVCLADVSCLRFSDHPAISRSIEGLMSLSFWMRCSGKCGSRWIGTDGCTGLGICLRISQ